MPDLSERKTGEPIPEERLRVLIEQSNTGVFVAYQGEEVVGAAIAHILVGFTGSRAMLQDFVTSQHVRGQGAGYAIWQELLEWCRKRGIQRLVWMSDPKRTGAHAFYQRQGAEQLDKNVFEVKIDS
ncbi:hypothetical protein BRC19_01270 [Candidatus Saccharibacteria bacterium QS_5_54_17]|nr:MAG: hypothetical protein BRC19_01270 [Candidatus Saccharibacteria bacterium QS_5_54_17]